MADTYERLAQYYKARRNLVIASGILLAWEFVGIEVRGKEDSAGDTSASLFGIKVDILNPEVIPTVVMVVTLYLVFRLVSEWAIERWIFKQNRPLKLDFFVSIFIATLSVLLFLYQFVTDRILADIVIGYIDDVASTIRPDDAVFLIMLPVFMFGLFFVGSVARSFRIYNTRKEIKASDSVPDEDDENRYGKLVFFPSISFSVMGTLIFVISFLDSHPEWDFSSMIYFSTFLSGSIIGGIFYVIYRKFIYYPGFESAVRNDNKRNGF